MVCEDRLPRFVREYARHKTAVISVIVSAYTAERIERINAILTAAERCLITLDEAMREIAEA